MFLIMFGIQHFSLKISAFRVIISAVHKNGRKGSVSRVLSVSKRERQPFVWPQKTRVFEALSGLPGEMRAEPLPPRKGELRLLGLAPDRVCRLPRLCGTVGSYPTLSHLTPFGKGALARARYPKRAVFSLRHFPYPYGPPSNRVSCPAVPGLSSASIHNFLCVYSGCPILRPVLKIIYAPVYMLSISPKEKGRLRGAPKRGG